MLINSPSESILEVRTKIIKALLDIPYQAVAKYEGATGVCKQRHNQKECDLTIYNSLTIDLAKFHLWPKVKPEAVLISVHLVDQIETVAFEFLFGKKAILKSDYSACVPEDFFAKIDKLIRIEMRSHLNLLLDRRRRHMQTQ